MMVSVLAGKALFDQGFYPASYGIFVKWINGTAITVDAVKGTVSTETQFRTEEEMRELVRKRIHYLEHSSTVW